MEEITIYFKFSGKETELKITKKTSVFELKNVIQKHTDVHPSRQKLMGLSTIKIQDHETMESLKVKHNTKFMLIGTVEKDIIKESKNKVEVIDDLDYDYFPDLEDVKYESIYREKLEKALSNINVHLINDPRKDKKLCVLDIDYTIFDCKTHDKIQILARPHLEEFLTSIYQDYDIAFWMWVEAKLTELGILFSQNYKVTFVLDKSCMFSINSNYKGKSREHEVKPLKFIWKKFNLYNHKNTVHVDDLARNFALNPKNGIVISPYKQAQVNHKTDNELKYLKEYLLRIKDVLDVTKLNHQDWKKSLQ